MVMLYRELLSRATNDVVVELREYCLRLLAQLRLFDGARKVKRIDVVLQALG